MKKIAVEKSLKNVKTYLKNQGLNVADLETGKTDLNSFDAVVVSGQDSNFLGDQTTNTKAAVINAKGMTVEDIYKQLNNQLS